MKPSTEAGEIYYNTGSEDRIITCDLCLHQRLGDRIDIKWNLNTGNLFLSQSSANAFSYEGVQDNVEIFKGVHFRHPIKCPLESFQIIQNPSRKMKACSCILLFDKKSETFLVTKRAKKKSLGSAWLLPGGHLETNQSIIQCAIRECEEEIGLEKGKCLENLKMEMMAFENPNVEQGKITKGGIILYFSGECEKFEIKALEQQISEYHWKDIDDKSGETLYNSDNKEGYGEGFLNYLQIFRENYKK